MLLAAASYSPLIEEHQLLSQEHFFLWSPRRLLQVWLSPVWNLLLCSLAWLCCRWRHSAPAALRSLLTGARAPKSALNPGHLVATAGAVLFPLAFITVAPSPGAAITVPLIRAGPRAARSTAVTPLVAEQVYVGFNTLPWNKNGFSCSSVMGGLSLWLYSLLCSFLSVTRTELSAQWMRRRWATEASLCNTVLFGIQVGWEAVLSRPS